MKITLNSKDKSCFAEILKTKEHNICAAEIYIDYLSNYYNEISFAKDENDFLKRFLNVLEINPNDKEFADINRDCKLTKIDCLNPNSYLNNEYYKLIKNIKGKEADCVFMMLQYNAFEGFVYNELEIDQNTFSEHTPLGYFEVDFPYPAVAKNGQIWMSIIPHEIETMRAPIQNAKGRVLVLGLGLGYYLFNILNKKEVTSVDVVELDKSIISLFNKYLINKFPHQEKINIIHEDGIEYLKKTNIKYDYVFSDIWHNVGDGEMLYLKIKANEDRFPSTTFDYWIETSILSMLRRQTLTVFEEISNGSKDSDYQKAKNDNDEIINRIYKYLKSTDYNSIDAIKSSLSDANLKEMAKHLFK